VLATATVPLLSLRNVDVLAFVSFTLPPWLINEGLIEASVVAAYVPLAYLAARFLWIGLRGSTHAPRASLYWWLMRGRGEAERRRLLQFTLAGLAVVTTVLTVSSTGANDVAFASLAGATDLIHGTVPYGHIPSFIVHGDTYPLLNYVIYMPAAAVMPVTDFFSDPQGALIVTSVAMLLAAAGLYRLGARAARTAAESAGPEHSQEQEPPRVAGLRAAIAWLAFPPVLLAASSGTNDVVLAACLVAVLASIAHPRRSVLLLGVAAWVKVIPVLALPIWLARMRGRAALESIAGLAVLSSALLGWMVLLGGPSSIAAMAHALSYQFDRGSLSSLWIGWGLGPLQPVAQAALVSAVVAATMAVRSDSSLRDDLPRLAALLAGTLLLAQVAANYWTWAYLPWAIAPALLLLVPAQVFRLPEVARQTRHAAPRPAVPSPLDASTSPIP